jgi:hypothetical protein
VQALAAQAVAVQSSVVDRGTSANGTPRQPVSDIHSTGVANIEGVSPSTRQAQAEV